jgi:hypothetical protein
MDRFPSELVVLVSISIANTQAWKNTNLWQNPNITNTLYKIVQTLTFFSCSAATNRRGRELQQDDGLPPGVERNVPRPFGKVRFDSLTLSIEIL